MPPQADNLTKIDGAMDWSQGAMSNLVTTIQSSILPNGLPRSAVSWLVNGTVRNGGIRPRSGWQPLGTIFSAAQMAAASQAAQGFFQGGYLYEPDNANPYLVFLFGGQLFMVQDVDNPGGVINLSQSFNLYMPAN